MAYNQKEMIFILKQLNCENKCSPKEARVIHVRSCLLSFILALEIVFYI